MVPILRRRTSITVAKGISSFLFTRNIAVNISVMARSSVSGRSLSNFPHHHLCSPPHPATRTISSRMNPYAAATVEGISHHPRAVQVLTPDADVSDAIIAGCHALGRSNGPRGQEAQTQLIQTLQNNWFSSAQDIAEMSDAEATALGVPLRLKSWITNALQVTKFADTDGAENRPSSFSVDAEGEEEQTDDIESHQKNFEEQEDWESLPIEHRLCPPLQRFGFSTNNRPNVVKRSRATKYSLNIEDLPTSLKNELEDLFRFGTQRFLGAQAEPIAAVTALKYQDHIRGMLGWMHRVRGVPIEDITTLKVLVPTSDRKGVALAFGYSQWLINERGINVRTELLVLRSVLYAAKFIYHNTSNTRPNSGEKPYSDLEVVRELRALISTANKSSKLAPRVADESRKWLDWPEYLDLCRELKKECALLVKDAKGAKITERPRKQVAWSLQRYLVFAILASCPDRQRTLRELEVGRTLVKEGDRWVIRHNAKDYKTGRVYGERPPLVLNPSMYPELEAFISTWRAELNENIKEHNYLFAQSNGKPFTDKSLSKWFMVSAYRVSGKRLTPHLVRDSIVTFLRKGNATERELEALALYMGHSIEMQRSSYDRRTKEEKVGPAVALLEALSDITN